MKLKSSLLGAVAVLSLTTGAALAGWVTPPGERAGIDLASPLPEGIYFVNLAGSLGGDRRFNGPAGDPTAQLNFDVPVIVWSTPWTILGGRVELIAAAPVAELGLHRGLRGVPSGYYEGFYNPYFAAELAWNLGNGFSVGLLSGGYVPMNSGELAQLGATNHGALDEQLSIAYHSNGWNATANLHENIVFNQIAAAGNPGGAQNSSAFIYDLGLTKTIGKWEIGAVAFGSFTNSITVGGVTTPSQSQFAMGGLVGYNFGPVITQVYLTSDLTTSGYQGGRETRLWTRVVIPLWNPEAPKVVAAKY